MCTCFTSSSNRFVRKKRKQSRLKSQQLRRNRRVRYGHKISVILSDNKIWCWNRINRIGDYIWHLFHFLRSHFSMSDCCIWHVDDSVSLLTRFYWACALLCVSSHKYVIIVASINQFFLMKKVHLHYTILCYTTLHYALTSPLLHHR